MHVDEASVHGRDLVIDVTPVKEDLDLIEIAAHADFRFALCEES